MHGEGDPWQLDRFAHRLRDRFDVGRVQICDSAELTLDDPADSVVVWTLPRGTDARRSLQDAEPLLRSAAGTIVVLPETSQGIAAAIDVSTAELSHRPMFTGWTPGGRGLARRPVAVFVADRYPPPEPAPETFRVAAIMTAYNEADIVRSSITGLIDQGIDVYLVDNWSDDGTPDLVADLVGDGLIDIERFPPEGRSDSYEWERLLTHTAEVATSLDHDWVVHHDVDQRRDGPWPGLSFRDGLWNAQRWGFNCVDHTIFEFRPTDEGFPAGSDVARHLLSFELVPEASNAQHIQAWRNVETVDLATSGGHDAQFDSKRVFPFNFTLRHYPVRSQQHGDRKVFSDRRPRYRVEELDRGWHYHYARLRPGHQFVREESSLLQYEPNSFDADHLVPRLGQSGFPIPPRSLSVRLRRRSVHVLQSVGLLGATTRILDRFRRWRSRAAR